MQPDAAVQLVNSQLKTVRDEIGKIIVGKTTPELPVLNRGAMGSLRRRDIYRADSIAMRVKLMEKHS